MSKFILLTPDHFYYKSFEQLLSKIPDLFPKNPVMAVQLVTCWISASIYSPCAYWPIYIHTQGRSSIMDKNFLSIYHRIEQNGKRVGYVIWHEISLMMMIYPYRKCSSRFTKIFYWMRKKQNINKHTNTNGGKMREKWNMQWKFNYVVSFYTIVDVHRLYFHNNQVLQYFLEVDMVVMENHRNTNDRYY
jgi:hypothetical protein